MLSERLEHTRLDQARIAILGLGYVGLPLAVEFGKRFDTIGYDDAGRVLEGGRSTVFALIDGAWVTPPVGLGVLPGVQRAALLLDAGALGGRPVIERALTVDELRAADRIAVANAVRGVVGARLLDREA